MVRILDSQELEIFLTIKLYCDPKGTGIHEILGNQGEI